jgi:hypothetical protein
MNATVHQFVVAQPDRKLGAALQQPPFSAVAGHLSRGKQGPGDHRRLSGPAAAFTMKDSVCSSTVQGGGKRRDGVSLRVGDT